MDLIKTIMLYMMMVISSAADNAPAMTAPPLQPPVTPTPYVTPAPTPAPTATPSPYTVLYVGDRGDSVKKLQRRLTELGYLNDKIDGIYGQNTKKAVERFQYYNNLSVDGMAGRDTQAMLYESPRVVPAPPNVTPAPTMPASVIVPVYYVDETGAVLSRMNMTCYGTTTIYANSNLVNSDYILASSNAVKVTVNNGIASPSSVTFRYQKLATPTPAPVVSTVTIPVYYRTTEGRILYQTSATLQKGATNTVMMSPGLVPVNYQLTSAATVQVTVNDWGFASPNTVIFTFRDASTPVPTQAPAYQNVTVYYLTEDGSELTREYRSVQVGNTETLYPNPALVPQGYVLKSSPSVQVTVYSTGYQSPEMVYFRYAAPAAPTQAPTQKPITSSYITVALQDAQTGAILNTYQARVELGKSNLLYADYSFVPSGYTPTGTNWITVHVDNYGVPAYQPVFYCTKMATPAPTPVPTPIPTRKPTPVPTAVPTRKPTPVPTAVPTPRPTPVPTAIPTPKPTPIPTPVPTPAPTVSPDDILTFAGSTINFNGELLPIEWYSTRQGQPMISLWKLADICGWVYNPNSGASSLAGQQASVSFDAGGVHILDLNGQSYRQHAKVWENDLYVSAGFLSALNIDASISGNVLNITLK